MLSPALHLWQISTSHSIYACHCGTMIAPKMQRYGRGSPAERESCAHVAQKEKRTVTKIMTIVYFARVRVKHRFGGFPIQLLPGCKVVAIVAAVNSKKVDRLTFDHILCAVDAVILLHGPDKPGVTGTRDSNMIVAFVPTRPVSETYVTC